MALVSIVVPVYHNAKSLPELLYRLQRLASDHPADRFEFIFVDDGSGDESFAVLQALQQGEERVRLIKLARNFGSNAALLAGMELAHGDAIAAIAADLQDPPELIKEMLVRWRQGRKTVLAARQSRGDPLLTRLLANAFYFLFRRFAIASMPKQGFDFFLIDRQVCNLINSIQESNAYLMGMILWLGFEPAVLYYHRQQREHRFGTSMWSFRKKFKYFIDAFVAFSYVPVRAASLLGISLSALGLLYAAALIIIRLFIGIPVVGWVSLMAVMLVVSGAQLLMTGILGEYLWRNLDETRRRPRFVIDRIIEKAHPLDYPSQATQCQDNGAVPPASTQSAVS
jgi:dolichol-phosphate mannosyltransferase